MTSVEIEGCSLFRNDNIWFSNGNFYHPVICWRDSTAGHKQSNTFLKCINDNNLLLVVEPMRRGDLLVFVSPKRRNLLGVKIKGNLGCSGSDKVPQRAEKS